MWEEMGIETYATHDERVPEIRLLLCGHLSPLLKKKNELRVCVCVCSKEGNPIGFCVALFLFVSVSVTKIRKSFFLSLSLQRKTVRVSGGKK